MAETLQLFYCDHHEFPLPPGHKFPVRKYRLLRERLAADALFRLLPSTLAPREELVRIHTPSYVDSFLTGSIAPAAIRKIGFPWSPELVDRTLASVGGTLLATHTALDCGVAGNLAGGTHHAFRGEGAGFCVFNDIAIAIAWARAECDISRAAVVDLDVHQGDGTAAIFEDDRNVFTFSMHGGSNFPFRKQRSSLDIELPDGAGDTPYLEHLHSGLDRVWDFDPELVIFQSGVDALASDRLGRLSLTRAGLRERNRIVLQDTKRRGIPVVITLGGGYSEPVELTVDAHEDSFRTAAEVYAPKNYAFYCLSGVKSGSYKS